MPEDWQPRSSMWSSSMTPGGGRPRGLGAGAAGGIPVQLEDGVGGYLASTPADVAARVVALLEDP
jgi:hypothetical protein